MEFGGKGTHEDINSAPTYPMERFGLRAGARPLGGVPTARHQASESSPTRPPPPLPRQAAP